MKATTFVLLLSGLCSFGNGIAIAADHTYGEVSLTISLVGQQQLIENDFHARLQTVRIGNKEILQLLSEALTNDLTGYRLKLRNDSMVQNQFVLISPNDGPEIDVTQYFAISWGEGVWKGIYFPFTAPEGTGLCIMSLSFDDGRGHSFAVVGPTIERASSVSKGMFTMAESNSWRMKAAGEGMMNGRFTVFQGAINARGRWTEYQSPF